jgi:hypothetical protein
MDDGLGFSIGALLGGFLYQNIGGVKSFQAFALLAAVTCVAHVILRQTSTNEIRSVKQDQAKDPEKPIPPEQEKLNET